MPWWYGIKICHPSQNVLKEILQMFLEKQQHVYFTYKCTVVCVSPAMNTAWRAIRKTTRLSPSCSKTTNQHEESICKVVYACITGQSPLETRGNMRGRCCCRPPVRPTEASRRSAGVTCKTCQPRCLLRYQNQSLWVWCITWGLALSLTRQYIRGQINNVERKPKPPVSRLTFWSDFFFTLRFFFQRKRLRTHGVVREILSTSVLGSFVVGS